MARVCDICHRGSRIYLSRSHSNRATKVRKQVNLQRRVVDGQTKNVCSSCVRTTTKRLKKAAA
ncbi:MAG: 50S ribosomal protein L28 [Patescibacteria group bacterium]